jgi:hypothetical protein
MKGYIYTMFRGADPDYGWILNDPIFSKRPTLGACMPNIRRQVELGDYIFTISGRVDGVQQYVVGGFRVAEKISALAAFRRLPENRLRVSEDGQVLGNIIVNSRGNHHPLDDHDKFLSRVDNYIIGDKPLQVTSPESVAAGREQTVPFLNDLFEKEGQSVADVIGRWRRLDARQIDELNAWLRNLRGIR